MAYSVCSDDLDTAVLEAAIWQYDSQSNSCHSSTVDRKSESSFSEESKLFYIESALTLNKINEDKLKQLETLILRRLQECRCQLTTIQNKPLNSTRTEIFKERIFGIPYFKDKNLMPAPINSDTKIMRHNKLINYFLNETVVPWTLNDRREFLKVITKMSQKKRAQQLASQVAHLKRSGNKTKAAINKIKYLENLVERCQLLSLGACALPIEETSSYDWEAIANLLRYKHKPEEYEALWKSYLHPAINKQPWTAIEQANLMKLMLKHNYQNWDMIAQELTTSRTGFQCFWYYKTFLVGKVLNGIRWTKEEDEFLQRIIASHRVGDCIPWGKVSTLMESKTKSQIFNRWINSAKPNIRKGKFMIEEDIVILAAIKQFGLDFKKIATFLPGRTIRMIRSRYEVSLQYPTRPGWTVEEDKTLMKKMEELGSEVHKNEVNNFSHVCSYFPGRSRHQIRRRYQILRSWQIGNPHCDLIWAPRRFSESYREKCKKQHTNIDLSIAYQNLKAKLQDVKLKPTIRNPQTNNILEDHQAIDDSLIKYFASERIMNSDIKKIQQKILNCKNKTDMKNMESILLLLKANLDKGNFSNCENSSKFKKLLDCDGKKSVLKAVRTYSRKQSKDVVNSEQKVSIWSDSKNFDLKYVLPANMATLLSCYACLLQTPADLKDSKLQVYKSLPLKHICTQRLLERCQVLFTWPLHLSNNYETLETDIFEGETFASNSTHEPLTFCDEPAIFNLSKLKNQKKTSNNNETDNWPIDLPLVNSKVLQNNSDLKIFKTINGNIAKIGEDDIKKTFGSNVYSVELKRVAKKTKARKGSCKKTL